MAATIASRVRVLAILTVFNEADILPYTVPALLQHDLDVFLIDDNSTDATIQVIEDLQREHGSERVRYKVLPALAHKIFNNTRTIKAKEDVWKSSDAAGYDWVMHVDADEYFYTGKEGPSLRDLAQQVNDEGVYNVIGFTLWNFYPYASASKIEGFQHVGSDDPRLQTLWRQRHPIKGSDMQRLFKRRDDFYNANSCGHWVQSPTTPIRISPTYYELHHFPIRSREHYERKVQKERLQMYDPKETGKGWHKQYRAVSYVDYLDHLREKGPNALESIVYQQEYQ